MFPPINLFVLILCTALSALLHGVLQIFVSFCFYVLFVAVIQRTNVDIRTPSYSTVNEFRDLRRTVYK
jgi:hypothetical protein